MEVIISEFAPLRLQKGDTIILSKSTDKRDMYIVFKRLKRGYLVRKNGQEDQKLWSNDKIYSYYVEGKLEHFAANLSALEQKSAELLESSWDSWTRKTRFEAERREAYCIYADKLHRRGIKLQAAWERAAKTVYRKNSEIWLHKLIRFQAVLEAEVARRSRKPLSVIINQTEVKLEKPSQWAIRDWYRNWKKSGQDIRALIPQFHNRGDRTPRFEQKRHLQLEENKPLCVYGAMELIAKKHFIKQPRVPVSFAYGKLVALCKEQKPKIKAPSETTFRRYIKNSFTEFEEYEARYGKRAAFFRFNLFERREPPERPLQEVEIDHTLLDVFVRSPLGHVARPWLTLLICRTTRCIIGMHIGFEGPSYEAIQRAVVHAMSPKNLNGISGIKHRWFCHGLIETIITDRGKDFLSISFKNAARDIGFNIVHLPGRCPYLKGAVERFFGTLNIRVLVSLPGSTASRTDQVYDPEKKARFTLEEITFKVVQWIVDDYHYTRHDTLNCTPAQRWDEKVKLHGVRPIPSFDRLMMLTGESLTRKIINTGIVIDGTTYASPKLEKLRKRRNGLTRKWAIRRNNYDLGHIWVLDPELHKSIKVPAVHQKTAKGITKYQAKAHLGLARKMTKKNERITDETVIEAMAAAQTQAQKSGQPRQKSRYLGLGAFTTPIAGGDPKLAILKADDDHCRKKKSTKKVKKRLKSAQENTSLYDQLIAQKLAGGETT